VIQAAGDALVAEAQPLHHGIGREPLYPGPLSGALPLVSRGSFVMATDRS
jgi:hypothetical protein